MTKLNGLLVRTRVRALALTATALFVMCATAAQTAAADPTPQGPPVTLQFLGQAIVPTGTMFAGTTVGGLSSITYDPRRGVYYAVSDDQASSSRRASTRSGSTCATAPDRQRRAVQGRDDAARARRQPYPPTSLDPEGLALTKDRQLVFTSEGFATSQIDPFVRRYSLDGTFLGVLPVPRRSCRPPTSSSGVRPNLGFESAGRDADGNSCSPATENALYQDGPAATIANGSPAGILRYNLQTGRLDRQWVYMTDPVAQPPVPRPRSRSTASSSSCR